MNVTPFTQDPDTKNALVPELINRLPVAIYTCDEKGILTYYNKAAAELWGFEPIIGQGLWYSSFAIYHTDGSVFPVEDWAITAILKGGKPPAPQELIVERPDGQRRNIIPDPQPLYDEQGQFKGVLNTLIDITAYRQTEHVPAANEEQLKPVGKSVELVKSEQRYHNMVNEVQDYAIILLDNKGCIQNWNQGAEKIKGYRADEVMGKNFSIFYTAEDRAKQLPEQLIAEAAAKSRASYEGWRLKKDGTMFWGNIVITALHDAKNNVIGFTKVTRDLTDKKLAEEQQLAHARLLEQKNKQLEKMNQELSSFVHIASHDLQEPLRKIETLSSYITDFEKSNLSEKGVDFFRRIINTAGQMKALIKDLLIYAHTSMDQPEQNSKITTDLNELLQQALEGFREKLESTHAVIEADKLPKLPVIPFQIRQLFSNLISNSLKYAHKELAPHISIKAVYVEADLIRQFTPADPAPKYLHITFADNGIGFEPDYNEQIFKIFQRLHNKSNYSGTGIGLAICKRIVENHNGYITAEGMPGKGAHIHIYLPA
ncbi:MAG: PAS domain S-box protein [Chitinophagaceae bacterium]